MTIYNTASDSANTAVRSFLTKVGEYYLGRSFNTGSGSGRQIWLRIRDEAFNSRCAYCNEKSDRLQIEHLIMFNRTGCGLHHPGNVVPCCGECNKREKNKDKAYASWEEHLMMVCIRKNTKSEYKSRKNKILAHIQREGYPNLNTKERHAIRVIADSLYENIKTEADKSLRMYKELDKAFVK